MILHALQHARPRRTRQAARTLSATIATSLATALAPALGPVLGPVLGPAVLLAQTERAVEAGAASVAYENAARSTALSLTPSLRAEGSRGALLAAGTLSRFASGNWSAQAGVDGALFTPGRGPLGTELSGAASASAHRDGSRAAQAAVGSRAHLVGAPFGDPAGAWAGLSAGAAWDGGAWRTVTQGSLGGWTRRGPLIASLSATPTVARDTAFTDAELALRAETRRAELGASLGARVGSAGPGRSTWAGASAVVPVAGALALVLAGGTYPSDPTQGLPGGSYLSAAVRLTSRPRPRAPETPRTPSVAAPPPRPAPSLEPSPTIAGARPAGAALAVRDLGGGRRAIRVQAPGATRVELMADFTDWEARDLVRGSADWWEITLPVTRGTHRMNVRVNGGAWTVPAGMTAIRDDFSGVVGILVVE